MPEVYVDVLKLLLALALGALIGVEREFRDKAAGFRTVIFICVGSALFTIVSIGFSPNADPSRMAAQVVTGVGFLGAGAILREGSRVVGLTTASIIWLAAAIGVGVGAGHYYLAAAGTWLVLFVLWFFPKLEVWIDNIRETRTYEVVCDVDGDKLAEIERLFAGSGLCVISCRRTKRAEGIVSTWIAQGSPKTHRALVGELLSSDDVNEFTY